MFLLIFASAIILITVKGLDLKQNQLVNGDFSTPQLTTQKLYFFDYNVSGWTCTRYCQIDNCDVFIKKNLQLGRIYNDCTGQAIDLNSWNINEVVTQIVTLKAGTYQLSLAYYVPIYYAYQKQLFIYFNDQVVFTYQPVLFNEFKKYRLVMLVSSIEGANNLTLTMTGPVADGSGFNINEVVLQRAYDNQFESILNETVLNSFSAALVSLPAYRVIFGELANLFVNFDRWQFYIFHLRNHSYNSYMFLLNIYNLMNMKGTFLQTQIYQNLPLLSAFNNYISSLDYKSNYTGSQFLAINSNGNGFIANNSNIFVLSLPLIICMEIVFLVLFQLTRRYSYSKVLRKYCFFGIILVMLFEGNIEQFTFYLFQELILFFSVNFQHKVANIALILLLFVMVLVSVSGCIWANILYKKHAKYFYQGYFGRKLQGMACCSFDKGLACMCFGAIHSLLLSYPTLQLCLLMFLEAIWICVRLNFLSVYRIKYVGWLQVISGFSRIMFQLTCLAYHIRPHYMINDQIHSFQIQSFLILWLIYLIVAIKTFAQDASDVINPQKKPSHLAKKQQKPVKIKEGKRQIRVKLVYSSKQIIFKQMVKHLNKTSPPNRVNYNL